jgi:orotate phosphoribosyltransferase
MDEEEKQNYVNFLVETNAVKIGKFVLKSGRISPYFISTGALHDGKSMRIMAEWYAKKILEVIGEDGFDVVLGPAYKGIPLAVAITLVLYDKYGINKEWVFNRKEEKEHGDKGVFVGADINGKRVVVVDDVMTTGGTKKEAISLIEKLGGKVVGIVIAVDREEKGKKKCATDEFVEETGIPIFSICKVSDLFNAISNQLPKDVLSLFKEYRAKYGCRSQNE